MRNEKAAGIFSVTARQRASLREDNLLLRPQPPPLSYDTDGNSCFVERASFLLLCDLRPREVAVPAGARTAFDYENSDTLFHDEEKKKKKGLRERKSSFRRCYAPLTRSPFAEAGNQRARPRGRPPSVFVFASAREPRGETFENLPKALP